MRKKVSIEEIKEAMTGNISPLKLSEIVDIIACKTEKETIKKIKKYAKKYRIR